MSGSDAELRKIMVVRPGWDCIRQPCGKNGCGDRLAANHGVHCDEWIYGLTDGQIAIVGLVWTDRFPATVPPHQQWRPGLRGVSVGAHLNFRLASHEDDEPQYECDWLDSRRCYQEPFGLLHANPTFQSFGPLNQPEQPPSFWDAFRRYYVERREDLARRRIWVA